MRGEEPRRKGEGEGEGKEEITTAFCAAKAINKGHGCLPCYNKC